jgi:hypothetical protein
MTFPAASASGKGSLTVGASTAWGNRQCRPAVFDASGALIEHDGPDTAAERAELCAALGA